MGWNNQRQQLFAGVLMAKAFGVPLNLPSHFMPNRHDNSLVSADSVLDLKTLGRYIAGSEENAGKAINLVKPWKWGRTFPNTVTLELNGACGFSLSALKEASEKALDSRGADALIVKAWWVYVDDITFDDGETGTTSEALWEGIQPSPVISQCASAIVKDLSESCPNGLHLIHMRVSDRKPWPLFECARGEKVLSFPLVNAKEKEGRCLASDERELLMEEVVINDPGPTEGAVLGEGSCVYVATDRVMHERTVGAVNAIKETGARAIMYGDILNTMAPECKKVIPSNLEQVIGATVPGRFVATFPSSWGEWVLHLRGKTGRYRAAEDLALYIIRVQKSMKSYRATNGVDEAKCFRIIGGDGGRSALFV
jgi:hypothetical protein